MQSTYGQIDANLRVIRSSGQNNVRLAAINISGEECQTHHYQTQIKNKENGVGGGGGIL